MLTDNVLNERRPFSQMQMELMAEVNGLVRENGRERDSRLKKWLNRSHVDRSTVARSSGSAVHVGGIYTDPIIPCSRRPPVHRPTIPEMYRNVIRLRNLGLSIIISSSGRVAAAAVIGRLNINLISSRIVAIRAASQLPLAGHSSSLTRTRRYLPSF